MSGILLSLLVTGFSLAVPLLLAALGELVVERSGVINVGIEGMVIAGAFAGYAGSAVSHSAIIGLGCAIAAGAALAALSACVSVILSQDQVVVGTAINLIGLGVTSVLFRGAFSDAPVNVASFTNVPLPYLSHLPWLGKILFQQSIFGYAAWLLVPLTSIWLNRTRSGLVLKATGEYPAAADASGASVPMVRFKAMLWGGCMAGFAGAFLSIGYNNGFVENMSAGRGFIALAVVILGRWNAYGVLAASLFFGVGTSLQFQFQATKTAVPYQLFLALPYLLTMAALLIRTRKSISGTPLGLGQAYVRR